MDELRQIELDVVDGERRLAELEARLIESKRLNENVTKVAAELAQKSARQRAEPPTPPFASTPLEGII
ncbi:hypothetical protein [Bradyrhizobium altum]|uniref:hypothetical protein n=1 Tax=Bradyrhizobium altum TaxID=1571202 RepID=UPI001E3242F4|nr:hypothetical protein [Bradyrhizobium altum]